MSNSLKAILIIIVASCLLISCQEWIEFDMKRYAFSFIITLIIGLVGLIVMAFGGRNTNDKK